MEGLRRLPKLPDLPTRDHRAHDRNHTCKTELAGRRLAPKAPRRGVVGGGKLKRTDCAAAVQVLRYRRAAAGRFSLVSRETIGARHRRAAKTNPKLELWKRFPDASGKSSTLSAGGAPARYTP